MYFFFGLLGVVCSVFFFFSLFAIFSIDHKYNAHDEATWLQNSTLIHWAGVVVVAFFISMRQTKKKMTAENYFITVITSIKMNTETFRPVREQKNNAKIIALMHSELKQKRVNR